MKKQLLGSLLVLTMVFGLTGCGKSDEEKFSDAAQEAYESDQKDLQESKESREEVKAKLTKIQDKYKTKLIKNMELVKTSYDKDEFSKAAKTFNKNYDAFIKEYSKISSEDNAKQYIHSIVYTFDNLDDSEIGTKEALLSTGNPFPSGYDEIHFASNKTDKKFGGLVYVTNGTTYNQYSQMLYVSPKGKTVNVNIPSLMPSVEATTNFRLVANDKIYLEVISNATFQTYEIDVSTNNPTVTSTNVDISDLERQYHIDFASNNQESFTDTYGKVISQS